MAVDPTTMFVAGCLAIPIYFLALGVRAATALVPANVMNQPKREAMYSDGSLTRSKYTEPLIYFFSLAFAGLCLTVAQMMFFNYGHSVVSLSGYDVVVSNAAHIHLPVYYIGIFAAFISISLDIVVTITYFLYFNTIPGKYHKGIAFGFAILESLFALIAMAMFWSAFSFTGTGGLFRNSVRWIPGFLGTIWLAYCVVITIAIFISMFKK